MVYSAFFRIAGISVACLVLSSFSGKKAFNVDDFLRGDRLRYASNMYHYEVVDSSVTPAPRGYVPFYISHISRHGSRGHNEVESYRYVDTLESLRSRGYLTPEGEQFLSTLKGIRRQNELVGYGALTDRGKWEHKNIARRMGENYPQVFCDPSRSHVRSFTTTVPRVMESMDSFTASLTSMYPGLVTVKSTSKDGSFARSQVATPGFTDEQRKELDRVHTTPFRDSLYREADFSRLINKTFAGGIVPPSLKGREAELFESCCFAGSVRQCYMADSLGWVEPYFTEDELYLFWKWKNAHHLQKWGWTAENKGYRAHRTECILNNIIADADAVIAGADTCATLRFTHDSVVLPLMCLIGVRGCEWHGSFRQIHKYSAMSYSMHMAGNLQFVFFRNGKNDVLVKILLNEEETVIPALKPDRKGMFYRWDRLKEYLRSVQTQNK